MMLTWEMCRSCHNHFFPNVCVCVYSARCRFFFRTWRLKRVPWRRLWSAPSLNSSMSTGEKSLSTTSSTSSPIWCVPAPRTSWRERSTTWRCEQSVRKSESLCLTHFSHFSVLICCDAAWFYSYSNVLLLARVCVCSRAVEWDRDWVGQFTEAGLSGPPQWAAAASGRKLPAGL